MFFVLIFRIYDFFSLVFGVEPDLTREGGSIPVTLTFQEATGKNVMLLPIGASDDGAHSQNEKIDKSNYINGVCIESTFLLFLFAFFSTFLKLKLVVMSIFLSFLPVVHFGCA